MKNQLQAAIHIGASAEAVNAARDAIMRILGAKVGDMVQMKALEVLSTLCSVNNTHITGNTFGSNATDR